MVGFSSQIICHDLRDHIIQRFIVRHYRARHLFTERLQEHRPFQRLP